MTDPYDKQAGAGEATGAAVEMEGETVDEAIDRALEQMGASRDEVEVEVLDEANRGLLGLRKAPARVRVRPKADATAAASDVVRRIVSRFPVGATVTSRTEDDSVWIEMAGEGLAVLIGHHGQTLDALQFLVNAILKRRQADMPHVVVDVEGYRARRKEQVVSLAERMVAKALERGEPIALRPMSAYDRKIVHTVVGTHEGISSSSSGEEPYRQVTIYPA